MTLSYTHSPLLPSDTYIDKEEGDPYDRSKIAIFVSIILITMDTRRQNKIARLIQKEMSEIFRLQTQQLRGVLVSVTIVRVTSDLSKAYLYLSIFPSDRANEILEYIKENASNYRYELGQRTGKQLRIIPEMEYHIDDSLDYLERIDALLEQ